MAPTSSASRGRQRLRAATTPKRHRLARRHTCRYAFPVEPISEVHYGAYHHDYPATDIFAPAGSAFVAPTDGTVNWVSLTDRWEPAVDDPTTRGGLSVAIIGADGVRYYGSHLREVTSPLRPGNHVRVGQRLGEVGNTGDARGIATHLHFGISHPTYPSDWKVRRGQVSPFPYLNVWRKGEPLTPRVKGARAPKCKPAA